jgi:hypothetical protein
VQEKKKKRTTDDNIGGRTDAVRKDGRRDGRFWTGFDGETAHMLVGLFSEHASFPAC